MLNQEERNDTLGTWDSVFMHTYPTPPIEVVDGQGAVLTDSEGKEYVDMLSGIAVNSLGYGHPSIIQAVTEQVGKFAHVSNLLGSSPAVKAARGLINRIGVPSKVFFCNSGAEANEAAFKLARLTGRRRVLAAHHGFHGRTMGSLALTGQPSKRAPFEPLPTGVEFYPYGDIRYLTALVEQDPQSVAAIFLEPIQGETGVVPAPEGFLSRIRSLCDEHGILMVVDEVQTGIGRTGDFFAFQHEGVLPDVITMAKGLGGGLPIGACAARGRAAELFTPGAHGTTFGGNPVACAAACAVLDTIDDAFVVEVQRKGDVLAGRAAQLEHVSRVRGRGLMLGLVLDQPVAQEAVQAGLRHGVIINAPAKDVIRVVPPLVITDDEIDTALQRLEAALADAASTAD